MATELMPHTTRNSTRACEAARRVPPDVSAARTAFYREELVKHWQCLELQREYYSEGAIADVQRAIGRLMSQMDRFCAQEHGDRLVSRLLRTIDGVTRLSVWSEQRKTH
jgi:hypothetical protein